MELSKAPHLINGPLGHRGCCDASHPRQQLAVLLPAQGQGAVGVGGQGGHEERLVDIV